MIVENDLKSAKMQAIANADSSGVAWILFLDTSRNLRLEKKSGFSVGAPILDDVIFDTSKLV